MEMRRIGADIAVAPLALGGNVFGWTADEATSFRLLDQFVDAGFNLIDTADVYSSWVPGHRGGESETIIGRWMKARGNRDKVVIATKGGRPMGPGTGGLSRGYLQQAVEASLRRLQTDTIDIYFSHRDEPEPPLADVLQTYDQLIAAGKMRLAGVSNVTAARLTEALDVARRLGLRGYHVVQNEYNLSDRQEYEEGVGPLCVQHQVASTCFYGLAAGFLTGKYRSTGDGGGSPRAAGVVKKYLNPRGLKILAALDDVAAQFKTTPATVSLAWLMARPGVTAAIASASRPDQMGPLLAAATLRLDARAIAHLDEASG